MGGGKADGLSDRLESRVTVHGSASVGCCSGTQSCRERPAAAAALPLSPSRLVVATLRRCASIVTDTCCACRPRASTPTSTRSPLCSHWWRYLAPAGLSGTAAARAAAQRGSRVVGRSSVVVGEGCTVGLLR